MPPTLTAPQLAFLTAYRAALPAEQASNATLVTNQLQTQRAAFQSQAELFEAFFAYEHDLIRILEVEKMILDGETFAPAITLAAVQAAAQPQSSAYFPQFYTQVFPLGFPSLMGTSTYAGTNEAPVGYLPSLAAEAIPKDNSGTVLATTGTNYTQMHLAKEIRLAALDEEEAAIQNLTDPGGQWDVIVGETEFSLEFRDLITVARRTDWKDEIASPTLMADITDARTILNSVSIPPSGTGPAITYDYSARLTRIADRQAVVAARRAEVLAEFADRYSLRYTWVNAMINRAFGSHSRREALDRAIALYQARNSDIDVVAGRIDDWF